MSFRQELLLTFEKIVDDAINGIVPDNFIVVPFLDFLEQIPSVATILRASLNDGRDIAWLHSPMHGDKYYITMPNLDPELAA